MDPAGILATHAAIYMFSDISSLIKAITCSITSFLPSFVTSYSVGYVSLPPSSPPSSSLFSLCQPAWVYMHGHGRIQDFVRGGAPPPGGPRPSWPPWIRAWLFGGAIFCGEGGGGQGPLGPPPRICAWSIPPKRRPNGVWGLSTWETSHLMVFTRSSSLKAFRGTILLWV